MEHLMKIIGGSDIETLVTYETLARMSLSAVKQPGIAVACVLQAAADKHCCS